MNELFVPYDIALGLKEIGFDFNSIAYYRIDEINRTGDIMLNYSPRGKDIDPETLRHCDEYKKHLKARHVCGYICFMRRHRFVAVAPTWDQAFDWFRKKHNLPSYIRSIWQTELNAFSYQWHIVENKEDWNGVEHFKTYEKAQTACLQRMIEQVKSNS